MIRNGNAIRNGEAIKTQVCVIGSGPAGITAAGYLQKAGLQVTLIEGSRTRNLQKSRPDKLSLYNGVADGLFTTNEPDFLTRPQTSEDDPSERERVFGGTSTHWGGQCRPLDAIAFRGRGGDFPDWPITREDLDPWYAEAASFCNLDTSGKDIASDFSADFWVTKMEDAEVPRLAGFETEMYQFIHNRNVTKWTFDGQTIEQSKADVILNASLLQIEHSGGQVQGLRVASMTEDDSPPKKATEFTIKADAYVLACGAVANARQLLLSNAGNEHDQVGRYFMCHPITRQLKDDPVTGQPRYPVKITKDFLTDKQRKLITGITWVTDNVALVAGNFSPDAAHQTSLGIGGCWFTHIDGGYYFELAPHRDNRVRLAEKKLDPVFGQPETWITWEPRPKDQETWEKTTALFEQAVEQSKGKVEFASWDEIRSSLVINGHHIGTTRMSATPEDGVVDANLKVHSLDNLYVAGASVYRTAGVSNPTFTVITLSIRLADHLATRLGRKPA